MRRYASEFRSLPLLPLRWGRSLLASIARTARCRKIRAVRCIVPMSIRSVMGLIRMPQAVDLRALIAADRFRAHEVLFASRHEDLPALWHRELVEALWSGPQRLVVLGFRGGAKSTYAEEFVALGACERAFRFAVFIGPSETRAAERLMAVSLELKMNDVLLGIYGDQLGEVTTQTKLLLRSGISVLALGRGQDIRGMKLGKDRPDLVVVDDFEDKENTLTPEGRRAMMRWFLRELRPACHPKARFVVLATIMHPDCVPLQLVKAGWAQKTYPISYIDGDGNEGPSWPARFPMKWVEAEREEYRKLGESDIWEMEMMCNAVDDATRDFRADFFRVLPRVRTWEPVYVMVDPARTRHAQSSATGIVAFSWIGGQLVVWEDRTGFHRPSETIDIMFELDERYSPAAIGFEEVGLEEWAL